MKISVIKGMVEKFSLEELKKAEHALEEERTLEIDVEGEDEGEQLTHVIAAAWIIEKMEKNVSDFKCAIREYTAMVRESIN